MTESHAEHVLGLACMVLTDYVNSTDGDQIGASRDILRLSRLVRTRGLPFLTVDLPEQGKHFDKCLSAGTYTPSHLPGQETVNGGVIPRLFKEILLRVFTLDGSLLYEPDCKAIAALRQLYYIAKKLRLNCNEDKIYDAVATFATANSDLPDPRLDWDSPDLDAADTSELSVHKYQSPGSRTSFTDSSSQDWTRWRPEPRLLSLCQSIFDIVANKLGVFDPEYWPHKHGPGRVSDLPPLGFKYELPNWHRRLDGVFPSDVHRVCNVNHQLDLDLFPEKEVGSKLVAVPKTQKGPRLIASEPVAHLWCQQSVWSFLESRVKETWLNRFVDFRSQRRNQDLARLGSQHCRLATVDLSAASDHVSLRFIESLFRSNNSLLRALHACRTRWVEQSLDCKTPPCIKLKMLSTMGNAFTFPVETIAFASLALASVAHSETDQWTTDEQTLASFDGLAHVFGDDIVIARQAIEPLYQLLNYFDFEVNHTKSFWNGRFRESCGVEAYDGVDVTPTYVLRLAEPSKPETVASVVQTSNNFFLKGLWRCADYLAKTVRDLCPVVHADSGAYGLVTFCASNDYILRQRRRWNPKLHRTEVLIPWLTTRVKRMRAEGWPALLQYFTEAPRPDLFWSAGVVRPSSLKLKRTWVPVEVLGYT